MELDNKKLVYLIEDLRTGEIEIFEENEQETYLGLCDSITEAVELVKKNDWVVV